MHSLCNACCFPPTPPLHRSPQGGDSAPTSRNLGPSSSTSGGAGKLLSVLLPLLLIIAAVLVNMYLVK
jgi:hypothetical protein